MAFVFNPPTLKTMNRNEDYSTFVKIKKTAYKSTR